MASIGNDPNGRKRILFVANDGKRKTIRIGQQSQKQAVKFKLKVEALVGQSITGAVAVDDEVSRWLAGLPDTMHAQLAAVGLVKPRVTAVGPTFGAFFDAYIVGRTDIKPNTLTNLRQARKNAVEYFGESRALDSITEGDAEEYWRHLIGRMAPNTARRLCGRAKQLFRFACRKRIIRDNPFADIECHVKGTPARQFFVTRDMAAKVTAACPDAEWRLIFALARFGGLRTPSETFALKWGDVDFERGRIRVPSPKTEHIEGKASRMLPMFPELRAPLLEVFTAAEPGTENVITRYRGPNLRTGLERIITRAGLTAWPKLFHNLRATRQTELSESYPGHVVCAWLGNTQAVAQIHYLQVTDEHFASAAQNAAQQASGESATVGICQKPTNKNPSDLPRDGNLCGCVQDSAIPPRGVEPLSSG
jgi:integrase